MNCTNIAPLEDVAVVGRLISNNHRNIDRGGCGLYAMALAACIREQFATDAKIVTITDCNICDVDDHIRDYLTDNVAISDYDQFNTVKCTNHHWMVVADFGGQHILDADVIAPYTSCYVCYDVEHNYTGKATVLSDSHAQAWWRQQDCWNEQWNRAHNMRVITEMINKFVALGWIKLERSRNQITKFVGCC